MSNLFHTHNHYEIILIAFQFTGEATEVQSSITGLGLQSLNQSLDLTPLLSLVLLTWFRLASKEEAAAVSTGCEDRQAR